MLASLVVLDVSQYPSRVVSYRVELLAVTAIKCLPGEFLGFGLRHLFQGWHVFLSVIQAINRPYAAIHHNSYDTGMTLQIFRFGTKKLDPKSSLYRPELAETRLVRPPRRRKKQGCWRGASPANFRINGLIEAASEQAVGTKMGTMAQVN